MKSQANGGYRVNVSGGKIDWLCLLLALAIFAGCSNGGPSSLADVASWQDFYAGAAVQVGLLSSDPSYAEAVVEHFNSITPENALKWPSLSVAEGDYDFSAADRILDFAESKGLRLRGHTLIWARLNGLPDWVAEALESDADPPTRLRALIEHHVRLVVGRYVGRIETWDVVNEPLALLGGELDQNLFAQTLGAEYIGVAFRAAHEADPNARLVLNEIFATVSAEKLDGLVVLVEQLRADGVPIHGVGLQGHLFGRLITSEPLPTQQDFEAMIDRLTALGVTVEFTEVEVPIWLFPESPDRLEAQAEVYASLFRACASRLLCLGVTVWGVDDSLSWLDADESYSTLFGQGEPALPLLLDVSRNPKPAYDAALGALEDAERR